MGAGKPTEELGPNGGLEIVPKCVFACEQPEVHLTHCAVSFLIPQGGNMGESTEVKGACWGGMEGGRGGGQGLCCCTIGQ